jgi:hypothetical protein
VESCAYIEGRLKIEIENNLFAITERTFAAEIFSCSFAMLALAARLPSWQGNGILVKFRVDAFQFQVLVKSEIIFKIAVKFVKLKSLIDSQKSVIYRSNLLNKIIMKAETYSGRVFLPRKFIPAWHVFPNNKPSVMHNRASFQEYFCQRSCIIYSVFWNFWQAFLHLPVRGFLFNINKELDYNYGKIYTSHWNGNTCGA